MKYCNDENIKRIDEYINLHKDDILDDLMNLVRIPSVKGEAKENAPYGMECAKCIDAVAELFNKNGFETKLSVNDGYLLSYYGNGSTSIGVFSHVDVVPVDDNWSMCTPFEPVIKDGYIFGRGCEDDKAGVIHGLYAAKIIRDLGFDFKSKLLMFNGSNEESGMNDIAAFAKNELIPDVSLVPDANYPCIKGERTILLFDIVSKAPVSVKKFYGGEAHNIVLGQLEIQLLYEDELYNQIKNACADNNYCECTLNDNIITVISKGVSTHVMNAENSFNAGKAMADMLSECDSVKDIELYNDMAEFLSDGLGKGFNMDYNDAEFGKTVCANGICRLTDDNKLKLSFDCRIGIDCDIDEIKNNIVNACGDRWDVAFESENTGYLIKNKNIINTLENVYSKISQITDVKSETIAGGTYARVIKNAIPVGTHVDYLNTEYPMPEGHGGPHQPDEMINIQAFLESIKLLTLYTLELDDIIAKNRYF